MASAFRTDIEGLRAVAVLAVLAFHAFSSVAPGGFVGVDVFFVISGFLIACILRDGISAGRFDAPGFCARRIVRLFPALLTILAAVMAFGWMFATPQEYAVIGQHASAAPVFASNFVLAAQAGYFVDPLTRPLLHLWSLAIEGQFYVFCSLWLLFAISHEGARPWLVGAAMLASFAGCILATSSGTAFFSAPARAWEFLAGSALALAAAPSLGARTRDAASIAGFSLVATACAFAVPERFPGWLALMPVLGAVLLIAAGPHALVNRVLLSHPVATALGRISYPLYLWHWVLLWALALAVDYPPSLAGRIAALAASFALAAITYRFVEIPIRRQRPGGAAVGLVVAAGATVAIALVIAGNSGLPQRVPASAREWLEAAPVPDPPFVDCLQAGECHTSGKRPLVIVWGDSHAARLAAGLQEMVSVRGGELIALTQHSCPPLAGYEGRGAADCPVQFQHALELVQRMQPDVIVLHARWNAYPPARLAETSKGLGPLSSRAIVAGPVPTWRGSLPRTLMRCAHDTTPLERWSRCGLDPDGDDADAKIASASADAQLRYVSLFRALCNETGCMRFTSGPLPELTTYDYGHLSVSGAAQAAAPLRGFLSRD